MRQGLTPARSRRDGMRGHREKNPIAHRCGFRIAPSGQALLVLASVLLITVRAAGNRFVTLDDGLYLTNVSALGGLTLRGIAFAFTSVSTLYWHPLAWLSHELDATLFGADPAGAHFTSVLLHAIAAGLLFLVLRRLGSAAPAAAGGALPSASRTLIRLVSSSERTVQAAQILIS
jgi:hypothetical protein